MAKHSNGQINEICFLSEFTNDGLSADLTTRKATVQVTVALTVAKSLCTADNKYLLVELHQAGGIVDPYMDNNRIVVELPSMECDDTGVYSASQSAFSLLYKNVSANVAFTI